jgi:ABC-type multidrug transport system permease subunit
VIEGARTGWLTLLEKELLRFWKVSFQTIAAPVLTALLYLLIFSHVLESRVAVFGGQVAYTSFLIPGLVMMSVLQNSFANASSSLIQSKVTGNLIFVLLPPLSPLDMYAASRCCWRRGRSPSCIRCGRWRSPFSAARSWARWASSPASRPTSSTSSPRSRTS